MTDSNNFSTAQTAFVIVKSGGGRFITVDAKKDACGFYERYGFRAVKSQKLDDIVPMYVDFKKLYATSKAVSNE